MSSGAGAGAGRGYGCGERRGRLLVARADARRLPDLVPVCRSEKCPNISRMLSGSGEQMVGSGGMQQ